ncbi:MAG TPA: TetR/AcrR family transcriptional regulator [Actinoplanes sp.]|nr:TetR/AcrR family transcriptional regulator [Actinoplanes sp.]
MTSVTRSARRRVPAMAPDERRAALIAATVPLVMQHGVSVSTRQIAQAAGVAEGTIFGVFPDKDSLVQAALLQAVDPGDAIAELTAIDATADLRQRLVAATTLLRRRFAEYAPVFAAARCLAFGPDASPEVGRTLLANRARLLAALADLIAPDRQALRRSPDSLARLLVLLIGAGAHGMFGDTEAFSDAELVALLLDGLLIPGDAPAADPDRIDPGGAARC